MNTYNTPYRQRTAGRRLHRQKVSYATGKDVTEHWERRAGDCAPIAGDSLQILEQRLAAIPQTHAQVR